ncbi:MAG: peptidoglycan D,D-transpeptidase FtsI family protein, partial [Chloroflexota bacterium]
MIATLDHAPAASSQNDLETRRWRVYLVAAVIVGVSLVLTARLVELQVLESTHFRAMATDEHWRQSVLPPRRGDIVDANGDPLATSVTYQSLYASTAEISDPARVASTLAPILNVPVGLLATQLAKKQSAPTLIQRWLPDDTANEIDRLHLAGLFLQLEPKRAYPQGNLAAQVLGVVGIDDNGLSGIELAFNGDVAGQPGELIAERDSAGDAIALGARKYTAPVDGSTLTLTIDRYVQWVAERELRAAVDRDHASGGTVVVLDPRTGAVLAVAGLPTFQNDDPDLYSPANVALFNIPAVHQSADPGSIFRLISLAAALDAGAVGPETSFMNSGQLTYFGATIHESSESPAGLETMTHAIADSSSVGTAWAATRVGAPRFYQYAQAFGFGKPTAAGLPGEVAGLLRLPSDADWLPFDLVNNSLGQGISVTPLQMAVAVAAIANGGMLMKPYLVEKVAGQDGSRSYFPTVEGAVIRAQTATNLTRMLVATVDDRSTGEARFARVVGYEVAGIGGIAPSDVTVGAGPSATLATFAGYAPAST